MWYVYRILNGEWVIVGQYSARRQADMIADDYHRRGIDAYVEWESDD